MGLLYNMAAYHYLYQMGLVEIDIKYQMTANFSQPSAKYWSVRRSALIILTDSVKYIREWSTSPIKRAPTLSLILKFRMNVDKRKHEYWLYITSHKQYISRDFIKIWHEDFPIMSMFRDSFQISWYYAMNREIGALDIANMTRLSSFHKAPHKYTS